MLANLVDILIHEGLTVYKTLGSKASLPKRVEAEELDKDSRKGVIFAVRDKSHFTSSGVKGYIVTSKESLLENAHELSHFTPNVFRYGKYVDEHRNFIKGFTEQNLQQINTFVIDIDTKSVTLQDILMACLEKSIGQPTLIVESPRGYQAYFVLEEPLFISNKNNFQVLKIAKRISHNLKSSLQCVQADLYCNDFGFFRMPTEKNIIWAQLDQTYSLAQYIDWSIQFDNAKKPLFVVPKSKPQQVLHTDWFHALIQATDVKGTKGQMGRNNTLFTLALICYQEEWDEQRTFDFLEEYNARLRYPLNAKEVDTVLRSAYSGRYYGASVEHIQGLLELYVPNKKFKVTLKSGWYKFKKPREERTRSHYTEWEDDIIQYIMAEKGEDQPFIWHTQKQLCDVLQISSSTLNEVLKKSKKLLITKKGKGRAAKTGWTTVGLYLAYASKRAGELAQAKGEARISIIEMIQQLPELEKVGGYNTLLDQIIKLEKKFLRESIGNSG